MSQAAILPSGTGSGISTPFYVIKNPMGLYGFGTFGSDTGVLERKSSSGDWVSVYSAGEAVVLSATKPQVLISGPGEYRVNFSARASAIGVDAEELGFD